MEKWAGGVGHLLMNKLQLSLGPLVQRDGSFGNREKSCLINGDINHGLARLAERRSVPGLIYGRDIRGRGEVMADLRRGGIKGRD